MSLNNYIFEKIITRIIIYDENNTIVFIVHDQDRK